MSRLDDFWAKRRFLVTGGGGFLGKYVLAELKRNGAQDILAPSKREYDLTKESHVQALFGTAGHVDVVIHLAGGTGGISFNRKHPGDVVYLNLMINTLVMEYARRSEVGKFVGVGSVCEYPRHTPVPFREEHLWDGYPEETNAPYGLAKRMMLVQGQAYRAQHDFNAIHLLLVNLYGPGDCFDPERSHVIPAIIKKVVDAQSAGKTELIAWGTGNASREFLYVEDAAEAIVKATENYSGPDPVNVGSGSEISTRALVELIARIAGFRGRISWDGTMPDGQPRRCLDTERADRLFGFRALTSLEDGLRKTIAWYREHGQSRWQATETENVG
jgi:GDP-L-fucose synthase